MYIYIYIDKSIHTRAYLWFLQFVLCSVIRASHTRPVSSSSLRVVQIDSFSSVSCRHSRHVTFTGSATLHVAGGHAVSPGLDGQILCRSH